MSRIVFQSENFHQRLFSEPLNKETNLNIHRKGRIKEYEEKMYWCHFVYAIDYHSNRA